ncbi:hypothetical protein MGG_05028 [Pyricularia oryzae 70-15]|uniref:Uncharacterized protein n=3 Tax=Pyricularia oryzae TaxID=318829 RepID=G4N3V5_PYRO7|nr:uncharacterized protein MGG_05028 [Pyricularia oryzae 70-15]ELQ43072.1 hypothetical protein OOU_Y34scaffold00174g37 [Pyricularia oryzae Y34]KAH8847922.1 hypothetical protein MCOR01_001316 [Pyricularia oryzae]EHA52728.1 hypothetical protein MGG_05028 [Pyricularia oryzae 70-15]KAI6271563.1 hypothetical protein MCOR34_011620 [Pyricularia oryzae]KAI6366249.1 hypothetical protein MCOR31_006607 [Pyricularia oryzae]
MAHHQHRRTYTRTILFSETFDFPTPPTWQQDEAPLPPTSQGHRYTMSNQLPVAAPWPAVPPTPSMPTRPMSRMPRVSHVPVTLHDKPLPEYPQMHEFIINCSGEATTLATAPVAASMPSPGEVSRWSICSDDTVVESMSRPLSPSSSIQKLRSMASSTALRSVKSSMKLRVKLNTTLKQLARRTKSMG